MALYSDGLCSYGSTPSRGSDDPAAARTEWIDGNLPRLSRQLESDFFKKMDLSGRDGKGPPLGIRRRRAPNAPPPKENACFRNHKTKEAALRWRE